MTIFEYVAVLVSIVVGLAMAHLLSGLGRMISDVVRWKVYWVHLVWVGYVFFYLVFFWWWEFRFVTVEEWTFGLYLFVILYAVLLYLVTVILVPRGFPAGGDFEQYYYARRKWFFGLMIAVSLVDTVDTLVKGWDYALTLGLQYWAIGIAAHLLLFALAIKSANRTFHAAVVVAVTLYEFYWAFVNFSTRLVA